MHVSITSCRGFPLLENGLHRASDPKQSFMSLFFIDNARPGGKLKEPQDNVWPFWRIFFLSARGGREMTFLQHGDAYIGEGIKRQERPQRSEMR